MNSTNKNLAINDYINQDYSGFRKMQGSQEFVAYRQNSFVRVWYNNLTDNYSNHWHSAIEIILPLENYYTINIQDEVYTVQPGEILMVPPRAIHNISAPESGSRLVFLFELEDLTKLQNFTGIAALLSKPIYLTHKSPEHGQVYEILSKIQEEYFSRHEYAELTVYAYLIELMVSIGYAHINKPDLFPNVREEKQKEYIHKFNQLIDYIDSHLNDDIDINQIAETAGFSKYHFIRLFKQYTGSTFADYVNIRRLKRSEALLDNQELSISEVASSSGFSSISTFNRIFKQYKGCSPSEYRNHHRIQN